MHPFVNTAVKAARSAGNIIIRGLERLDKVQVSLKNPNDYVTEVDKAAEKEIIAILRQAYPSHGILAEESGYMAGDNYQWIIDPLDGTTNFVHGLGHCCVSIALKYKNRIEHGIIYDPVRQDLFTATRGEGAQKNNYRIRVSARTQIEESLLASSIGDNHFYQQVFLAMTKEAGSMRCMGSAALSLAYVASGQVEGYWESELASWDLAAGALMVKEAGGLVSDFAGGENYLETGNIIAGNPKIFKRILQIAQSHLPEVLKR